MTGSPHHISLVGAGKLAWQLGHGLMASGIEIRQVCSRSESPARDLAQRLGATYCAKPELLAGGVGAIILAVPDQAIEALARQLYRLPQFSGQRFIHTSGATGLGILQRYFPRAGVLYPLQTFSGKEPVDFRSIPIIVQGSDEATGTYLELLGKRLSSRCIRLDESQRLALHLSAVLVNNFVNALAEAASGILSARQIPFSLLEPLLDATIEKIRQGARPVDIQTGPAARGDTSTMDRHLAYLLDQHPHLEPTYRVLSELIRRQQGLVPSENRTA